MPASTCIPSRALLPQASKPGFGSRLRLTIHREQPFHAPVRCLSVSWTLWLRATGKGRPVRLDPDAGVTDGWDAPEDAAAHRFLPNPPVQETFGRGQMTPEAALHLLTSGWSA